MSKRARLRLEKDTEMADSAAVTCLKRHKEGKFFSLEHPGRSIALDLESWRALANEQGVFVTPYHTCMFDGSSRRKSQVLIHNLACLKGMGRVCSNSKICDRSGKPHHKWRPIVNMGRVSQYVTGEEREYPKGFCSSYAACLNDSVQKSLLSSFVEIYSGPNAPLSNAISERFSGESIQGVEQKTIGREFQSIDEVSRVNRPTHSEFAKSQGHATTRDSTLSMANRQNALGSGRQPSFGKRTQLIPDGINSPLKHLAKAKQLVHPFDEDSSLKAIHRECLRVEAELGDPRPTRESLLRQLSLWKSDPEVRRRDHELKSKCGIAFARLGKKLDLGLMEKVQQAVTIEDTALPLLCSVGLPITGKASESPFFVKHEEPQRVSLSEFTKTCKKRRLDALRRTQYMGTLGGEEMGRKIRKKLEQEVLEGTMGPSRTPEFLERRYGPDYNVIPSFGLKQGVNAKGEPKYRRIDDHSAGWVNHAAKRIQKIPMANADYIPLMLKSHAEAFPGQSIHVATADMRAAYRQVALCDSDLKNALTAVYQPGSPEPTVHEMFGQPFGAGHAVPNFYRLAEWLHRFICRFFSISCDHFFDDFWIISRDIYAESALSCLLTSAELLGIVFDDDKTQPPSAKSEVLGVIFNTSYLGAKGVLYVQPRLSRVVNLHDTIQSCLTRCVLTPNHAASIVGKFGFLCSTMFGKAGRCASLGVRARQYSASTDSKLNASLEVSLRLMQYFLRSCPPRELHVSSVCRPLLLYTDASDVPERSPRFGVGAVLIENHPSHQKVSYFSWSVPNSTVDKWLPKKSYMGQLELLAAPIALATWKSQLSGSRCLHFVDNDSASACLVRGYSPKSDSCEILDLPSYHIIWYMVSFVPENTLSGSNGFFSKKSRFFTLLGGHGWVKILKKYRPERKVVTTLKYLVGTMLHQAMHAHDSKHTLDLEAAKTQQAAKKYNHVSIHVNMHTQIFS